MYLPWKGFILFDGKVHFLVCDGTHGEAIPSKVLPLLVESEDTSDLVKKEAIKRLA